jgi:hypothetical protein
VVELEWQDEYHVRFLCKTEPYPLRPRTAVQFRRFCDILVFNDPGLLLPQNPLNYPRPPTEARWRVSSDAACRRLWVEDGGIATALGSFTSTRTAARAARATGHCVVTFHPHPLLTPFAQLWNLSTPRAYASTRTEPTAAARHVADRTALAHHADPAIRAALGKLSWRRILRLPSSVSTQRLLMLKIKGQRLSGWVRSLNARGCPHCAQAGVAGGHTFDIVWHCPAAQDLWNNVFLFWNRLGLWRRPTAARKASFLQAVFSICLPATPIGAAHYAAASDPVANPDTLRDIAQQVWARHVLSCFQVIWAWRQGIANPDAPWTFAAASSALRGRFLASLHAATAILPKTETGSIGMRHFLTACRRLVPRVACPAPAAPTSSDVFVIFFDGGSRGTPAPRGGGQ